MTMTPKDKTADTKAAAPASVPIDGEAVAKLTRLHALEAVDALLSVMNDGDANAHARVAAAREMLHWSFRNEAGKALRGREKDRLERIVRLSWGGKKLPQHGRNGHEKNGYERKGHEKKAPGPEKGA